MKRSDVGSCAIQTGSLKTNLSNARISRYFGGGSGAPTTREVVHFSRLSIPNGFSLSAKTPDISTSKTTTGRPSRPHRTFITLLSHNEGVQSTAPRQPPELALGLPQFQM